MTSLAIYLSLPTQKALLPVQRLLRNGLVRLMAEEQGVEGTLTDYKTLYLCFTSLHSQLCQDGR